MRAPVSSARYSREREMAIWMMLAAMGARMASRNAAMGLVPPSSSLLLPPKMAANCMKLAMLTMTEASTPATVWIEDVTVGDMADLVGDDAAQLLGAEDAHDAVGDGHHAVFGVATGGEGVGRVFRDDTDAGLGDAGVGGKLGHHAVQQGASSSDSSRAWYMDSTILSEYQ